MEPLPIVPDASVDQPVQVDTAPAPADTAPAVDRAPDTASGG